MTAKNPSQTELYGELLDDVQRYKVDMCIGESLTPDEEVEVLQRAKRSDIQVQRELFITALSGFVFGLAAKYCRLYQWASPRIELLDLAQEANITILQNVERAMTKDIPFAYLRVAASHAVIDYCRRFACAVLRPETDGVPVIHSRSLDAPASSTSEEGRTLAEVLVVEQVEQQDTKDYAPLYLAIDELTPLRRDILCRSYGLYEHGVERGGALQDGKRSRQAVSKIRKQAMDYLRERLEKTYVCA